MRRIFGGVVGAGPDGSSSRCSKLRLRLDVTETSVNTDVIEVVLEDSSSEFCRVDGTDDSVSVLTKRSTSSSSISVSGSYGKATLVDVIIVFPRMGLEVRSLSDDPAQKGRDEEDSLALRVRF